MKKLKRRLFINKVLLVIIALTYLNAFTTSECFVGILKAAASLTAGVVVLYCIYADSKLLSRAKQSDRKRRTLLMHNRNEAEREFIALAAKAEGRCND